MCPINHYNQNYPLMIGLNEPQVYTEFIGNRLHLGQKVWGNFANRPIMDKTKPFPICQMLGE